MRASNRLLTDVDRNWAASRGEEKKRAPWRGYDKRSGFGSYLDTPRKDEHRSDTLTFPSTTIDNISLSGAAKQAALAAGQAVAVAHVAAHELGAAAYAIKAAREAALDGQAEEAGRLECQWQRAQLPREIRDLVLDDQKLRNDICWFVFEC